MNAAPGHAFGLDALRATAVASVLLAHGSLFHAESHPGARFLLVIFGVLGVEIFFALSGFLVGRQLLLVAEGRAGLWRFLVRRWVRTLPNYYLFLAINAALAWWVIDRQHPDAQFLWFGQAFAWPATSQFFPESWSLAVEEWFYLLAALAFAAAAALRASPRALGWGLVAVLVAGPLARVLVQLAAAVPIDAGVRKISLVRLDALAYGLGCAWLERHRPGRFDRLRGPALRLAGAILAILGAALLAAWSVDLRVFEPAASNRDRVLAALLFSALPMAAACMLPFLATWRPARSRWVGTIEHVSAWSYSIYLVHFPLLLVMGQRWSTADAGAAATRTATWLVATLVLSAAVYRYFESPLLRHRPALRRPGDRDP